MTDAATPGSERPLDALLVGAGLVGLSTARALGRAGLRNLAVLEAAERVIPHQSGHNSGIIHSGLYYKPGSLKATLCTRGRVELIRFCEQHGVTHEICGKLVVATRVEELPRLDELERRGAANGLEGVRRLTPAEMREHEPHVAGLAGLFVPQTGIVDYGGVAAALVREIEAAGGRVQTGCAVRAARADGATLAVETTRGTVRTRLLIGCAGLQSDRVARACGMTPDVRIVPFRGEYLLLKPERRSLVRNLIYPVPDPRFPFLGVHFTRRVSGEIEAGPNAVLALAREGYRWGIVSVRDLLDVAAWPGFWRMAARHLGYGAGEVRRSLDRHAMAGALRRLLPELRDDDVVPAPAGVRAQGILRDGTLVDDFVLAQGERQLHVLNAPSPAATASLAIGEWIASRASERLTLD